MTLFDYYAQYMTELWEGKRPAPAGITLPEDGDEKARIQSLAQQLQTMGIRPRLRRSGRHGAAGGAVQRARGSQRS